MFGAKALPRAIYLERITIRQVSVVLFQGAGVCASTSRFVSFLFARNALSHFMGAGGEREPKQPLHKAFLRAYDHFVSTRENL